MERETMTVEEAGERLGISRGSAYKAVKAGEIPIIRVGGRILVPVARFEALLRGETHAEIMARADEAGVKLEIEASDRIDPAFSGAARNQAQFDDTRHALNPDRR